MSLYIGLMSGTSLDGIDAALVDASEDGLKLVETHYSEFDGQLKNQLHDLLEDQLTGWHSIGTANAALGHAYAHSVQRLLEKSGQSSTSITAIGCHGQTVFHAPNENMPFSIQLGDGDVLAELTGITTVCGFRGRDLAAGGQGAPLVPGFHHAAFANIAPNSVIVNIGGIANITCLSPSLDQVSGFDTGPGNALMNEWIRQKKAKDYDDQGSWAASGDINESLLQHLLSDPYFKAPAPKSTGREYFSAQWLAKQLTGFRLEDANVQTTLAELSARSIADAIQQTQQNVDEVFICGGGARNEFLMARLEHLMNPITVRTTDSLGFPVDWIEAMAFAWLAKARLEGQPGNVPSVTGAKGTRVLGAVHHP